MNFLMGNSILWLQVESQVSNSSFGHSGIRFQTWGSIKVAHNDIIVGRYVEQSVVYGCYEYISVILFQKEKKNECMSVIIEALHLILFF